MSPVASPNVSIPRPKPSALVSPVPPQGNAAVPEAPPAGNAAQAAPGPDADLLAQLQSAGGESAPNAAQASGGASAAEPQVDPALLEQLSGAATAEPIPEAQITEGEGASTKQRVIANLGRSPEEQRRLLEKSLGEGFETKLGGKNEKEVLFRKIGDEKFQRMDPGFFHSLSSFGKDVAALSTKIGIDAATGIVGEALGVGAGALTGGPVGAFAGLSAGAAAGGAAAAGIKEAAIRGLGVTPAVDVRREAAFNALLNAGTVGVGTLVKTPLKTAITKVSEALGESSFARVLKFSKLREGIDEIQQAIGYSPKPNAALGENIASATDALADRLGEQISAVNTKALAIAGDKRFPVAKFQDKLRGLLQEQGVVINGNGLAEIPAGLEATKPFGAPEGMAALKALRDDFNQLTRANGTMDLKQLTNTLSFYKAPAGFEERLPTAVNGAYQTLRGALREERDTVLPQVLAGTAEGDLAQSAYASYSSKIDALRELQDKALRKGSPEKFAEALIAPKDSAGVKQLKGVFGEDSAQFSSIKSAWFSGVLAKAVDSETGLISGSILKKELNRYGDDVVGQLLTGAQKNALSAIANNAEKISYAGLIKNPENSEFLRRAAGAMLDGFRGKTEGSVRTLWSLFSSNKAAMDYLSNDGLLELAKTTSDPAARSGYVKIADWIGRFISASEVVVSKNGRKSYVLPLELPVASAIINAHDRQSGEALKDFLTRKQSTINEVTGR